MRIAVFVSYLIAILPALLGSSVCADDLPYPAGWSKQTLEERRVYLVLPEALSRDDPASLVLALHGSGGTAKAMAQKFEHLAKDGYVICAPKALELSWEVADVRAAIAIGSHLKEVLPIDPKRVHAVGYSNGGWELGPVAFSDELRPCSATWISAGFRGGPVPRWAKDGLAAIVLVGSKDPDVRLTRRTVSALRGKVRSVELHEQAGLGLNFPRKLMPYLEWWLGVQDGRVVPGDDRYFDWQEDLPAAIASQSGRKKGGVLLWLYAAADADLEETRTLQRGVFFDPDVRFLGRQIASVKLDAAGHQEVLERYAVKSTPALVVLDRKGEVKKVLQGGITARKLARALKSVAPRRTMPKN